MYTGRFIDQLTGLQWHLHRWYDPALGRWLSEDPIGFAGDPWNLYRYVGNAPTNATDPTGLLSRQTGYGHSGNAIAEYVQKWPSIRLNQAPPYDVVLIQRVVVTLEFDRTDSAGGVSSFSFGPVSYYEEIGVINKGQTRLSRGDTWSYSGDTQFPRGQPQITREQITQSGLIVAFCLSPELQRLLSTWKAYHREPIGNTSWLSGGFRASKEFDSSRFEIWEWEDHWHRLISTWTKQNKNRLLVDGRPT
jgi:RHS repeat-associated protein